MFGSKSSTDGGLRDTFGQPYLPAVSPRLKILLALIFATVAVLGATGAYLSSIRMLDLLSGRTYTTPFKYTMLIAHVGVGVLMTLPFLVFGAAHWWTARTRPNRKAVRLGVILLAAGIFVCLSGFALIRLDGLPQLRPDTSSHTIVLILHILAPIAAVGLYVWHRRAGPDIQWRWGASWGAGVGLFCIAMLIMHGQDPRQWYQVGPKEGVQYFHPSEARTATGNFIPAETLMMDEYCMKCHADIYKDHLHSAHRFSSFNNPPYLFSVRQTREVGKERDGHVKASRWCAGCHDPVPFFSGAFDDPKFDDEKHATAHAAITCTVCHAITNVNSPIGNGAYTIEEPQHYPLAFSKNPFLQWVNNQVVKAEPSFHKKTFLKPFHKTAEFCSTCHKVALPVELNHYKEFLRGQNHYDPYILSGVSGHSARAFYYPPKAKSNCAECHMPLKPSGDFGARDFDNSGKLAVHNHRFPAANTGLFDLLKRDQRFEYLAGGFDETMKIHKEFLRGEDPAGKKIRIDLFGVKDGGDIDGKLTVLRPELPKLKPGGNYLIEVVVRTLLIGHPLTQGTVDSNEIWVDFEATANGKTIARNGALSKSEEAGEVDRWAHFINVHMLDRNGNRINRRNPQDIFTPLYDHQIPPGAAAVVHYRLDVPNDAAGPIELRARVRYRKFDDEYLKLVFKGDVPKTPIVDICEDRVTLPIAGGSEVAEQKSPIQPAWQRWNDYGIGCYIEGGVGMKKGELKQALEAFYKLAESGDKDAVPNGWLNAARVLIDEGRLSEAVTALNRAGDAGAPWWGVAWFKGVVAAENASKKEDFDAAIAHFERIVDPRNQPTDRGFDFRRDYVVLAKLGNTFFKRSQLEGDNPAEESKYLRRAIDSYHRAMAVDPEDLDSHYGLYQCFNRLGRNVGVANIAQTGIVTADMLHKDLTQLLLPDGNPEARLATAGRLIRDMPVFASQPLADGKSPATLYPKLPAIRSMMAQLQPAFLRETNDSAREAMSAVLAQLHREAHAVFKPDEVARSRTVTEYRRKNPAANHAAEAIVIYPTTSEQKDAIVNKKSAAMR
jgi:tetratricopeptide (TPR) repeat protein